MALKIIVIFLKVDVHIYIFGRMELRFVVGCLAGKEPSATHKARAFIMLLSISATYVITDMYSANLTSLLARPGREKAINNLYQLKGVMQSKDFKLFVEKQSPSYGLLENGSGIYGEIWDEMERRQNRYAVESVEEGVKLVRDNKNVAVMAGRETLLMAIFEAGIITKMTENEYENLGKQQKIQVLEVPEGDNPASDPETKRSIKSSEDDKLKPINLKMLQGVFYLLFIGNIFAGLVLLSEISLSKFYKNSKRRPKVQLAQHRKICKKVRHYLRCVRRRFVRMYRNFRHDAFTLTLEYLE
ncbi:hypothetical protein D910_07159 [Dendroctonus ponderosae]|uniref:Ionotropic glutamate receptor C-terminal domain-containing protein n=1 Tax=Dendroctonus ponderosae TaxID=77166 RepID=U4UBU2_DENPD|nr:hypothetical protein D910_07159 [Dendroctonus ponderosae]